MELAKSRSVFLALTGLEEFWDKSQPMVLLGQWCKSYDKLDFDNEKERMIFDHPDLVDRNTQQAYHYTFHLYEKLLPKLANWLNQIHGSHHSLKYWRIVIGSFLLFYIQVTYHRWNALKIAISSYSNLNTIGLAKHSYLTPINTLEFCLFAAENDAWNHQLMTQILNLMSFDIKSYQDYRWEEELKQRQQLFGKKQFYKKLTRIKIHFIKLLAKLRKNNIVGLHGPGGGLGTNEDLRKVFFLSRFKILPLIESKDIQRAAIENTPINISLREGLSEFIIKEDAFSRILIETLKINFPINFIENYKDEVKKVNQCYPFSPRVLLGGWILDDRMAIWAAKLSERGSTLVSTQHGGAYGMLSGSSYEALEKANSDLFISWGWEDKKRNVLPAPSVYI